MYMYVCIYLYKERGWFIFIYIHIEGTHELKLWAMRSCNWAAGCIWEWCLLDFLRFSGLRFDRVECFVSLGLGWGSLMFWELAPFQRFFAIVVWIYELFDSDARARVQRDLRVSGTWASVSL